MVLREERRGESQSNVVSCGLCCRDCCVGIGVVAAAVVVVNWMGMEDSFGSNSLPLRPSSCCRRMRFKVQVCRLFHPVVLGPRFLSFAVSVCQVESSPLYWCSLLFVNECCCCDEMVFCWLGGDELRRLSVCLSKKYVHGSSLDGDGVL